MFKKNKDKKEKSDSPLQDIHELGKQFSYLLAQARAAEKALTYYPLTLQDQRILLIRAVLTYKFRRTPEEAENDHPFNNAEAIDLNGLPEIVFDDNQSVIWDDNKVVQCRKYVRSVLTDDDLLNIQIDSYFVAEQKANELLGIETLSANEKKYIEEQRKKVRNQYLTADHKRFIEEISRSGGPREKSFFVQQYLKDTQKLIGEWSNDLTLKNQKISLERFDLSHVKFGALDLTQVVLTGCQLAEADLTETLITQEQLMDCRGFSTIKTLNESLITDVQILKTKQLLDKLTHINERAQHCFGSLQALDSFDHLVCWETQSNVEDTTPGATRLSTPLNLEQIPNNMFALWAYLLLTCSQLNSQLKEKEPFSYSDTFKLGYEKFSAYSREEITDAVMVVLASRNYQLSREEIAVAKCNKLGALANQWRESMPQSVNDVKNWLPELTTEQTEEIQKSIDAFTHQRDELKRLEADYALRYHRDYISALLENLHGARYPTEDNAQKRLDLALSVAKDNPNLIVDLSGLDLSGIDFSKLNMSGSRCRLTHEQVKRYLTLEQRKERCEQLRDAVKKRNFLLAQQLLEEGVEPDLKGMPNSTALKLACEDNQPDLVELLIQHGATVEFRSQGFTILQAACRIKGIHPRIIELLLSHGATMDLASAIALGDKKEASSKVRSVKDINEPTSQGEYILHLAVEHEAYDLIDWLVKERNAKIDQRGPGNFTPLFTACKKGLKKMTELLLRNKANKNAVDRQGRNGLRIAIDAGHLELAHFLLTTYEFSLDWFSAIHLGMIEEAQILLGGKLKECDEASGYPPLHVAVLAGQRELIEIFLSLGAVIEQIDNQSLTALSLACREGKLEMVKCLLDNNALLNGYKTAMTPPLFAVMEGLTKQLSDSDKRLNNYERKQIVANYSAIMALLLKKGVDLKITRNDCTVLHQAAKLGEVQLVKQLLLAGADFSARDAGGNLPLQLAVAEGHQPVVEILLAAYVQDKNASGFSALQLAEKKGDEPLLNLVFSYATPTTLPTKVNSTLFFKTKKIESESPGAEKNRNSPSLFEIAERQRVATLEIDEFLKRRCRVAKGEPEFPSEPVKEDINELTPYIMRFVNGGF